MLLTFLKATLLTTLAVTLLNPHVYLDTLAGLTMWAIALSVLKDLSAM